MTDKNLLQGLPARELLASKRVLVVGDVMLDRYWHGAVERISPEAPVPVVRVEREEERLGGAANVALLRFGPRDGGKRAALSATLSFTAGLALGPVFSGLALQQDLYPTTLPFLLILGMAACAIGGWC